MSATFVDAGEPAVSCEHSVFELSKKF
jgi:hypothetical protein